VDALLNWLWQGCAVTLAATVIVRARVFSAATRYYLWWATMLLVLMLPVAPTLLMAGGQELAGVATNGSPPALTVSIPALPGWPVGVFIALWSVWTAASLWRAATAFVSMHRAKRACRPFPPERERRLRSWLSVRTIGRPARLVISHEVRWAAVLGLRSPLIAVAPALLYELNDQELDQVLVHEWAHVQRRDDATCLLQVIIHAVAGLHPAAWWIDRRLKVEREAACDDWAVRVTGSSKGFASCLTRLAMLHDRSRDAVLVPGALSGSALTTRIVRLLDPRRNASPHGSATALALITPVLVGLVLLAASVKLVMIAMPITRQSDARQSVPVGIATPATAGVASADAGARPRAIGRPSTLPRLQRGRSVQRLALETMPGSVPDPVAGGDVSAVAPNEPRQRDMLHPAVAALTDLPGQHVVPGPPADDRLGSQQKEHTATPWGAAADAGVTVGRGSQKAAVATAGFFTRLGKSMAGAF
jgi:beta-lactamase regulating signal transducer with metallopeptidase domain